MRQFTTKSSQETIELGKKLIEVLPKHLNVILLNGDLSSGKTTFTKGIALGLGIKSVVNSPTFTILKSYEGKKKLNHLDLYRLDGLGMDFDLEEYIEDEDSISVIEWPSQVKELIPNLYVNVDLKWIDDNTRIITISTNDKSDEWMNQI
ncbi:tRNA (adenosine(37)-N6)-threonylcarbamoyltransferase complex ATPase subunit type 1 TsaE [Acholeplasma granularum]|uniref:tRNA (adenosine(37)-N6)-threonylcarbamoyltransferase complex ATPase subunit type 1 TsaE n=1 Tax=Acholeplasma granularum TaxID=264635 RepID=UPI0004B6102A|nr:tRNA (adenosine(37)-N6)-threonylcarbamoyltransferase complex ATPase subunit type 1 TsaE [Acholeplasma granularum]